MSAATEIGSTATSAENPARGASSSSSRRSANSARRPVTKRMRGKVRGVVGAVLNGVGAPRSIVEYTTLQVPGPPGDDRSILTGADENRQDQARVRIHAYPRPRLILDRH